MTRRSLSATVLMFLSGLVTAVPAAQAADVEGFALTAVVDRAHGDLVMAGQYELAAARNRRAARLGTDDGHVSAFWYDAATNLCVSLAALGQADEGVCDAAVRAAQAAHDAGRRGRDTDRHLAAALSNRGVVRALAGDVIGAQADFARAAGLAPSDRAVAQNAAHLDATQRLAGR